MSARNHLARIGKLALGTAVVMALVAAGWAHADINQAGTTAANFLSVGTGARALGMGGAILGFNDDLAGGAWNPAAFAWNDGTGMVLSHAGLDDGSSQEWLGVGGRFGRSRTRWMVSGLYQGHGSIEGRDASNLPTGSLSLSSFAFGAHVAHQLTDQLGVGFAAKGVSEQLGDVSGLGMTFDAGATFRVGNFGAGIAGQNLGGQMRYSGTPYPFPWNLGAGVAWYVPRAGLRLGLDLNVPKAYYSDVRFGAEWLWRDMVALRGGYRHEMGDAAEDLLSGPSFGAGAGSNGWWIDYGYLVPGQGEAQHRLGITFSPGRMGPASAAFGKLESLEPRSAVAAKTPKASPAVASKPVPKASSKSSKSLKPVKTVEAPKAEAVKPAAPAKAVAAEVKKPEAETRPAPAPAKVEETRPVTPPAPQPAVAPAPAPATPKPAPAASAPAKAAAAPSKVVVRTGDTLASIGRRYGVSAEAIMMENNLVSESIKVGQVLQIPPPR